MCIRDSLYTDEHQQHAHTHLQVAELIGYRCQQEEEGTQAQDGEDIREEHHERVERYLSLIHIFITLSV